MVDEWRIFYELNLFMLAMIVMLEKLRRIRRSPGGEMKFLNFHEK